MAYSALINTPIVIYLPTAATDSGWTEDGVNAMHQSCNNGSITLTTYPVTAGHTYQVGWAATAVGSGSVQLQTPGSNGVAKTAPGLFVENVAPTSNGFVTFYSNGNCTITGFNILDVTNVVGTTIVYSALNQKWSDFRTYYPDFGWSQYENTITAYQGQIYIHQNGGTSTNNFYGTQYQSIIQAVFAKDPEIINTYEVLSYQANQLLVTTQGGITTPLGQQSTLIASDFLKYALTDNVTTVNIYQNDNVYSAAILNDENSPEGVISGDPMRGNYIIVELITADGSSILKLFSLSIKTARTYIGNR